MNQDLPFMPGFASQGMLVPDYVVRVEGVPLPPAVRRAIVSVTVTHQVNQPASFQMQVNDPQLLLIDAAQGLLAEGRRVEIDVGYAGNTLPVIEGEIAAIGVNLDDGGGLTLQVEGFDGLHTGTRGTGYRQFREDQSDSAVVRQIAGDMLPIAVVDETGPRSAGRIQHNVNNLQYLQQMAQFHGFQLWVAGRTLYFMRRRPAMPAVFAKGVNLISFSTRLSTTGQVGEIEVRGWDPARKEPVSGRAFAARGGSGLKALSATGLAQVLGAGAGKHKQVIHAQGEVSSRAEAQARADAAMLEQSSSLLSASGSVVGDPQLRVGSTVSLQNMGRFSLQSYLIERLTHQIDQAGYRTSFEMKLAP